MRLNLFIILLLACFNGFTQDSAVIQKQTDSLNVLQTTALNPDSAKAVSTRNALSFDSSRRYVLQKRVQLNLFSAPEFFIEKEKELNRKEWLFYYVLGLVLLFGLLRLSYQRYFNDLFRVFFRTSLRVNQIREQLVQSGLQSLLFNIFFAVSAGTYVYLLCAFFQVSIQVPELFIPFLASVIIGILYLGKYLFLRVSGWLFGMRNATETYSFIVFLINKLIGVLLLPFIVIIAFAGKELAAIAVTISLSIITGLFMYRFLRAYNPVHSDLKVGRFHFFIFFLAFEIAPLLILYKVFLQFL